MKWKIEQQAFDVEITLKDMEILDSLKFAFSGSGLSKEFGYSKQDIDVEEEVKRIVEDELFFILLKKNHPEIKQHLDEVYEGLWTRVPNVVNIIKE